MILEKKFLMIENPGECPVECFTVLGASLADTYNHKDIQDMLLGQFGSGTKNSICVLLRNKLKPYIFLSNLKLEFYTKEMEIKDDMNSKTIERICVEYSGKDSNGKSKRGNEQLTMTTAFGKLIWDQTSLALRELVSNAIDFCLRRYGNWDDVNIKVVEENQVRAKSGYTRIFVPLDKDVESFYFNLGKWFLHFSEPESLKESVLTKTNRNFSDNKNAVIYRRGVFIREFTTGDKPSLFDYNLTHIELDEARKASDWDCHYYASIALASCKNENILDKFFYSIENFNSWEYEFHNYGMSNISSNKEKWKNSFEKIYTDSVITIPSQLERVERKGYKGIVVTEQMFETLNKTGIKTYLDILSKNEIDSITIVEPTTEVLETYNYIWTFLEKHHLTRNKEKCPIHSFVGYTDAGSKMKGFFRDNEIYIDIDESSESLFKTIMHEIAHYVTGSLEEGYDNNCYLLSVISAMNNELSILN